MATKLTEIQRETKKKLRITFKSSRLLESALIHPSYRNEVDCPGLQDFNRLEFFGDTILNFVICQRLFTMFPKSNEGELSRLRSTLVSRKVLFRVAKDIGFVSLVKLSDNLKKQSLESKTKILADAMEAFIAALHFDQGLEKAEKFILKHFKPYLDPKKLARIDPNPKSTLQEIALKQWKKLPVYSNTFNAKEVKTTVTIGARRKSTAIGKSRQESEQKAARLLIQKVRQELAARSKRSSSRKKLRKAR